MTADAATAGFYESATGENCPRVQLPPIEALLSGTQRAEHPDHQPDLNVKKAETEPSSKKLELEWGVFAKNLCHSKFFKPHWKGRSCPPRRF